LKPGYQVSIVYARYSIPLTNYIDYTKKMKKEHKLALIAAYYLSRFDRLAYQTLNFGGVIETHEAIGNILGVKTSTIQNMRDEFDPYHKNTRKGWWQRELAPSRRQVKEKFENQTEAELRQIVLEILNNSSDNDTLWSDRELEIAVNSYLYMLKLQVEEIPYSSREMTKHLLDGPLKHRKRPALRTRMRNISDVLAKMDMPVLNGFTPASRMGNKVRKRLERIIIENIAPVNSLLNQRRTNNQDQLDHNLVLSKLNKLEQALDEIISHGQTAMIGHNHPPEPIENIPSDAIHTRDSIEHIQNELNAKTPDKKKIEDNRSIILTFGLKIAIWAGKRFEDFSSSAAKAAGPMFMIWAATKFEPQILDAMKALSKFLGTLI
jgi:5-methylcytosine-specific restriction protein A